MFSVAPKAFIFLGVADRHFREAKAELARVTGHLLISVHGCRTRYQKRRNYLCIVCRPLRLVDVKHTFFIEFLSLGRRV